MKNIFLIVVCALTIFVNAQDTNIISSNGYKKYLNYNFKILKEIRKENGVENQKILIYKVGKENFKIKEVLENKKEFNKITKLIYCDSKNTKSIIEYKNNKALYQCIYDTEIEFRRTLYVLMVYKKKIRIIPVMSEGGSMSIPGIEPPNKN